MSIAVVDYDAGNVHSVMNALKALSLDAELTDSPSIVERARFVVLPGVGSFDHAVLSLKKSGLFDALKKRLYNDLPTLGICLGMQLMFEGSDEGSEKGLNIFGGRVEKLSPKGLPVPHVGWTTLIGCEGKFGGFENEYFYFVHSYAVKNKVQGGANAYAEYGEKFVAAVSKGNVAGAQFHPEKSGKRGLELLKTLITGEGRL